MLKQIQWRERAKMTFSISLMPRNTRWMGSIQDLEYVEWHEILPPGDGRNRTKLQSVPRSIRHRLRCGTTSTFFSRRPDGIAFDKEKLGVFLEYTRAMDTKRTWIGPRKRIQRKTKDTVHISASSITSAQEETWLERHTDQLHNGSTRLPSHQQVSYTDSIWGTHTQRFDGWCVTWWC